MNRAFHSWLPFLALSMSAFGGDPVPSDNCSAALPVGEGTTPFSTVGATPSGILATGLPPFIEGAPNTACKEFGQDATDLHNDIWFEFTPPASANFRFSTCNAAGYDTKLALYSAGCTAPIALACNDDTVGCAEFTSDLLADSLSEGQTYLLQVGAFMADLQGSGSLTIERRPGAMNYCTTTPNSAGTGALIACSGSFSAADDDLVLEVSGAIPAQFGVFYWGLAEATIPFYDGVQCIALPVHRFNPNILSMDGTVSRAISITEMTAVMGETAYLQFAYRDPASGSAANTSDGLAVTYGP